MNNTIYKIIKTISVLIRYGLCCITIEQILLFESETAQRLWSLAFGGVLYTVLRFLCYSIVGKTVKKRVPTASSSEKSLMYFFLYVIVVLILFGVLKILTCFGVLPIGVEVTFNLLEWFIEKMQNIFQSLWNCVMHFIVIIATKSTS